MVELSLQLYTQKEIWRWMRTFHILKTQSAYSLYLQRSVETLKSETEKFFLPYTWDLNICPWANHDYFLLHTVEEFSDMRYSWKLHWWYTLIKKLVNPFHATGLFRYPLKTSENQRFPDMLRGYRKRPVAWNWLMISSG